MIRIVENDSSKVARLSDIFYSRNFIQIDARDRYGEPCLYAYVSPLFWTVYHAKNIVLKNDVRF